MTILEQIRKVKEFPRMMLSAVRGPAQAVILVAPDADGVLQPAAVGGGGGSDPGSARETTLQQVRDQGSVTATYDPQQLNVGIEIGLDIPVGATHALVTLFAGQVQAGLRNVVNAPTYSAGDSIELSGAQLAAWRMIHAGNVDSLVRVDYWREGAL